MTESRSCACGQHCAHCLEKLCTHGIPIFASLRLDQLEKIAEKTRHRTCEKGDVILEEGSHPDYVAILNKGTVKASRLTADGREQILYVFSEGDFFGEQNLLSDRPSAYAVTALESVQLCLLFKKDFQTLLADNPDIGLKIIGELGWRMARLENAVRNMGVRSLESRIGAVLLEFVGKYGEKQEDGVLVRMPLSREGLANYIGIARETVSRKLGMFEDEGMIRSVGARAILIRDMKALEELAG
jgi:CRP/FNR family transcriptional regulator, anaerobic regulatory protein